MKAARGRQTAFSEGKVVLNSLLPRKECDETMQLLVDVKLKFFMGRSMEMSVFLTPALREK